MKKSQNYSKRILNNKAKINPKLLYDSLGLSNSKKKGSKSQSKSKSSKKKINYSWKQKAFKTKNKLYKKSNAILDNNFISYDSNQEKGTELRESRRNIFNTKKNLDKCSELLKAAMDNEKQLILIPYAKKKEKINKTFDTIGDSNGISYPTNNIIQGIVLEDKNYLNIIRDEDKKTSSQKKNRRVGSSIRGSKFKDTSSPIIDNNNNNNDFGEINIQDFNI